MEKLIGRKLEETIEWKETRRVPLIFSIPGEKGDEGDRLYRHRADGHTANSRKLAGSKGRDYVLARTSPLITDPTL